MANEIDGSSHSEVEAASRALLVAEEDGDLRDILVAFLEAKGFRIVSILGGPETLVALHADSFVAAIIDVPIVSSPIFALLQELRLRARALPIVVIVSFGDDAVSRTIDGRERARVLEKPFDLEQLDGALRELGCHQ